MIAKGAESILKARLKGIRPADEVYVSLVGKLDWPAVLAEPGQEYDWRWAKDLDIVVVADSKVDWGQTVVDLKLSDLRSLKLNVRDAGSWVEVLIEPVRQVNSASGPTRPKLGPNGQIWRSGWLWELRFNDITEMMQ